MIDVADITEAIASALRSNPGVRKLISDPERITRGEYVNRDPANAPWLGVYRQPIKFAAKTLGAGPGSWQLESTVLVLAQAHADGGQAAEDELCDLVDAVLTALIGDLTFGGTIGTVRGINVEWSYQKTDSDTLDFQEAMIIVNFESRAP